MTAPLPQWRIIGATVTGTRHKHLGEECEDALASIILPGGCFACAIADGAGSASASKEGAQRVVAAALTRATELITDVDTGQSQKFYLDILQQIVEAARHSLERCAQNFQTLNDFATTLLFVLMTPHWLAAFQLGDGAIVVRKSDDTLKTVTMPDYEEYINETHFVTDADYLAHVQYIIEPVDNINGLAMLTDGLQMLALELATHKAYASFFLPLFAFSSQPKEDIELTKELEDFLAGDRVSQRTDDDKTLLLAVASYT